MSGLAGQGRDWRTSVTRPHEHLPLLIDGELLDANQLNFQILQVVVIELKLALECPIGDPLPLTEEVKNLIEEGVKVHLVSSLGPPSQTRVPVLVHLVCASIYHSRKRKERGR